MNALAMDQARRIAQTIHRTPSLRGRVSAGLYVGESERTPHTAMGPDHVITDRGTLRERPPDILLTNYKMLDFLLIRPIDHRLWRHNAPDTLRYVVVDELHTFDGAQGTDLACLIRRLRSRLEVARERLICVGTSATIGGEESREELLGYVSRIFDQPFEPDAIVGEVRQGIDEFLGRSIISHSLLPRDDLAARVRHTGYATVEDYIRASTRSSSTSPSTGTSTPPSGGWHSRSACASTSPSSTSCACSKAVRNRCPRSSNGCARASRWRAILKRREC